MDTVLRILVVDDTAIYRRILSDVVSDLPGTDVVGTAHDGPAALRKVDHLRPDMVLLDVNMPGMSGLDVLSQLSERKLNLGVVMVSGTSSTDVDLTVEALSRGALDFVPKPVGRDPETSRRELVRVLKPIINAFRTRWLLRGGASARPAIREYRPPPKVSRPRTTGRVRGVPPARLSLLAIGVSTGGPNALHELVPALSPQLSLPVLIVQHMPAGFTRSLAAKLDRVCGLEVREAEDGDEIRAGRILIAPGGRHMVGRKLDSRLVVGITDGPPVKSCRPSVDVLFRSLAGLTPSAILTLTLTGMGDDGADGVQTLARYGSYNLVQDEETCVVYGMPRAVNERGLAHEVHPLSRLAARINDLGRRGPRGARR